MVTRIDILFVSLLQSVRHAAAHAAASGAGDIVSARPFCMCYMAGATLLPCPFTGPTHRHRL